MSQTLGCCINQMKMSFKTYSVQEIPKLCRQNISTFSYMHRNLIECT